MEKCIRCNGVGRMTAEEPSIPCNNRSIITCICGRCSGTGLEPLNKRITKTRWTKGFTKYLTEYLSLKGLRVSQKEAQNVITDYEFQNNCTIVFVQLDENGVAKKGD